MKANYPPTIQNLTCSITCSRNVDCTCCTDFVSSIADPDLSECPETFKLVDNQNGLFVDPQDSSLVCYTESSIQQSIEESIEYQVTDTGGYISNTANINFNFNVPTLCPTPSVSITPTTSATNTPSPSASETPSTTPIASVSPVPSITSSNTPSSTVTQTITPKESLILVIPSLIPSQTRRIVASSNQVLPSVNPTSSPIPTSAIGACTNSNCQIGSLQSGLTSGNQNIQLISDDGNNIGVLIVPNSIAPQGTLYVSYVSNINVDTNAVSLGNAIFDISILDEFGSSVSKFDDSMKICFEEENSINDNACLGYYD